MLSAAGLGHAPAGYRPIQGIELPPQARLMTASKHHDDPDQCAGPVVVIGLDRSGQGWEIPFHHNRKAQLLFADTGMMTLEVETGVWVVPPQGAVWIPGGMEHRARISGQAQGFVAFIEPNAVAGLPAGCCTLSISPFVRALLQRIAGVSAAGSPPASPAAHARLQAVLLDELSAAPLEWLHLPLPRDLRLRQLTQTMLAAPQEQATLEQWARRIGMSERNMSRLFALETGMGVSRWRRQMHVVTALPLLAQGQPVHAIAEALGYDSAGAFVTMFRKAVGMPPKRFLAERSAGLHAPLHAQGFPVPWSSPQQIHDVHPGSAIGRGLHS